MAAQRVVKSRISVSGVGENHQKFLLALPRGLGHNDGAFKSLYPNFTDIKH
jgi:hypothetical protein